MRRWKRSLILLLAVCLSVSFLSGCTSNGGEETGEGAKIRFASVDKGIHNKTTKYGLPTY